MSANFIFFHYHPGNSSNFYMGSNFGAHLQYPTFKTPLIFHTKLPISFTESKVAPALPPMAVCGAKKEALPPALDSSSHPPALFNGVPKLGLQDQIMLVPIDLKNRPSWYKEKVYPENKVPSLEHNNQVRGESLDLIRYIDSNFAGPSLFPDDPAKIEFAQELLSFASSFYKAVSTSLKEDQMNEAGAAFDDIETALSKFEDGPFFLGQFSLVDIAYAPFVERFQPFLSEVKQFNIISGRPRLAAWIEEMNEIDGYRETQCDPKEHVESYKARYTSSSL